MRYRKKLDQSLDTVTVYNVKQETPIFFIQT